MTTYKLNAKIFFLFIGLNLHFVMSGQFKDTITNVYQDKDLTIWTETYIVQAKYVNKTSKGYQIPLSNHYYKQLSGLYSLRIIEKQDFDTASVVLYWMHAGTDNDRPIIIKRVITNDQKSKFIAIGRTRDLTGLDKLYALFEQYKKFTDSTQLFCYKLLLQNHAWYLGKVEE